MNSIKVTILGADKRQLSIYEILKNQYSVEAYDMPGHPTYEKNENCGKFVILPTVASKDGVHLNLSRSNEPLTEDFISSLSRHTHLITGICQDNMKELCTKKSIYLHEYTKDETFKLLNAVPTAEGAIALAVQNTEITLWRSKCLIIGNGCIGKALGARLLALGANVTVSARKAEDFAHLDAMNIRHIETKDIDKEIGKYNVIFNTVPKRILQSDSLEALSTSTLFVDLASAPYGVDHERANEYPCKILKAGSLPGKFSPTTAAELAAEAIGKIIEKVSNNG